MGDNASFGYLQGIETAKAGHKVWFIGDIGNNGADRQAPRVPLFGALNFTDAYKKALADIDNGTYGTHGKPDPRKRRYLAPEDAFHLREGLDEIRAAQTQIQLGKLKVR